MSCPYLTYAHVSNSGEGLTGVQMVSTQVTLLKAGGSGRRPSSTSRHQLLFATVDYEQRANTSLNRTNTRYQSFGFEAQLPSSFKGPRRYSDSATQPLRSRRPVSLRTCLLYKQHINTSQQAQRISMASPSPPASPSQSSAPPEPEQDADADLPMTMAASVLLDNLPKDATRALETAGELGIAKGKSWLS